MRFDFFLGVDPGKTGGYVLLDQFGSHVSHAVMGTLWDFVSFIQDTDMARLFVTVEKAQAMPKNGAVSMFNYGLEYGKLLGALGALQIVFQTVSPGIWTKTAHQGLSRKLDPKERSREAAERGWPGLDLRGTMKCKKPHEGLVDAILIAEYGRKSRG